MAKGKALAIPVPGPGRKSLYREQYAEQAFKLCLLGAKDTELAHFFGVSEKTLNNWKDEHPAFLQSIIDGKEKADAEVAHSLYKMATGHTITAEKLVKKGDDFEAVRYKQYIPGDSGAAYRWLLNRRRQDWTDKQVHEHIGTVVHEHRAAAEAEVADIFGPTPHEITLNA
jgi:hypothetical protein